MIKIICRNQFALKIQINSQQKFYLYFNDKKIEILFSKL